MGNFRASRRSRLTRTKLLMEAQSRMTSMLVIMWHAQYPNFHLRRMSAGVGLCLSSHLDHVRVDGDHNADCQIYHGERDNHQAEPLHHTVSLTMSVVWQLLTCCRHFLDVLMTTISKMLANMISTAMTILTEFFQSQKFSVMMTRQTDSSSLSNYKYSGYNIGNFCHISYW